MTQEQHKSDNAQDLKTAVVALKGKRYEKPQGNPQGKEPKMPPTPRKLGVSIDEHPGRRLVAEARLRSIVEQEAVTKKGREAIRAQVAAEQDFDIEADDDSDEDPKTKWIENEVERRMAKLAEYKHPRTTEFITEFGPDPQCRSKRPKQCNDLVEMKALRALPYVQALEEALRKRADGLGAHSERKMSVATFMVAALTGRTKVLKRIHSDLSGSDLLLDDAVDHPAGDGEGCRAYNSVSVSVDRQLNTHDPEMVMVANGAFLRARRAELGEDYGRRVVLDAMPVQAHLLQHKGFSKLEKQLLKRGFTAAAFGYHGEGKGHNAWALLILRDAKSLDILAWMLAPYNQRENGFVEALFLMTFEHFPEWQPEVLIADSEYDVTKLYENLLSYFGVHLICPLRNQLGEEYTHGKNEGVPKCSKHEEMKRVRDREFPHREVREKLGLRPGEPAPFDRARTDWKCEECGVSETTWFKHNARIFGYYPRRGDHKLVGQREAMQVLRNISESTNASLQYRHFGLKGQARAKWVSTDRQAAWLLGMGLFAMNMRQLIHGQDGLYERTLADVAQRGLLKPQRSSKGALTLLQGGASAAGEVPEGTDGLPEASEALDEARVGRAA